MRVRVCVCVRACVRACPRARALGLRTCVRACALVCVFAICNVVTENTRHVGKLVKRMVQSQG